MAVGFLDPCTSKLTTALRIFTARHLDEAPLPWVAGVVEAGAGRRGHVVDGEGEA